jgi:SHAQKYF class myb-like DNA-binding protein
MSHHLTALTIHPLEPCVSPSGPSMSLDLKLSLFGTPTTTTITSHSSHQYFSQQHVTTHHYNTNNNGITKQNKTRRLSPIETRVNIVTSFNVPPISPPMPSSPCSSPPPSYTTSLSSSPIHTSPKNIQQRPAITTTEKIKTSPPTSPTQVTNHSFKPYIPHLICKSNNSPATSSNSDSDGTTCNTGPWTKEEHEAFLLGFNTLGRQWKTIANKFVKTRDRRQVSSHAQKYFAKTHMKTHNITTTTTAPVQWNFHM